MIMRRSVYFTSPKSIEIREESLPEPGSAEVVVQTQLSAISPGTELMIYQGLFPQDLALDENILSLKDHFGYPLKYGYSAVGKVITLGPGVDLAWKGRTVFAFNPHESHFIAPVTGLIPLPQRMTPETAVFLPNMETAVNFVMDGKPLIGERVVVLGQGIVGLLTTALLAQFPLERLVTLDRYALRRQASLDLGVHASLDPGEAGTQDQLHGLLPESADLCFELTGSPAALDQAIAVTGFDGRVIVGSWYGQKQASLDLGGRFHRSRIRLISSQVSTLAPELSGRWSKNRRFDLAWEMLRLVKPARWITHRFALHDAALAYQQIDQHPDQSIQVVLTYP
jgi:2-desacetyl-2-hydroxyethyl bacteriochlorophyllide A dehydrogenase